MQSSPSLSDEDNSLPNNAISRNRQGLENLHDDVNYSSGIIDGGLQPTSASKSRKRVADIWNFFTIEGGEAVCRCGRRYKHVSSYGTSTLRNHALKCPLCKDDFEELNPQKYARKSLPANAPTMMHHSLAVHGGHHSGGHHHNSNFDLILRQKQSLIDFLWISKTVPRTIYQPSFIQSFLASNLFHSLKNIDYFQINHYGTFLSDIQETLLSYRLALSSILHQPALSNHHTYYQGKYHIIVKLFTASTDKVPFIAVYLQYIACNWQVKQLLLHIQPLGNTIFTTYESFFEEILHIVHFTVHSEWGIQDSLYSIHLDNIFIPSHTIYEQFVKQVYTYFPPAAPRLIKTKTEKTTNTKIPPSNTVTTTTNTSTSGETSYGQKRPALWCPLSYPMMLQMIGSEIIVQLLPLLQRISEYYLSLLSTPSTGITFSTHTLAMIQFLQSHLHFFQYPSYSATTTTGINTGEKQEGVYPSQVLHYPVNLFHQEDMMSAWLQIYHMFHQHFFYEHHPYYSSTTNTGTSTGNTAGTNGTTGTTGATGTSTGTTGTTGVGSALPVPGHDALYTLLTPTEYMNFFQGFYLLDVLARNIFPTASAMSMSPPAHGNTSNTNTNSSSAGGNNTNPSAPHIHSQVLNHSMKGHLVYAHVHDLYHELLRHSTSATTPSATTTPSTTTTQQQVDIQQEDFFAKLCSYLLSEYHHYFIPYCTTTFPQDMKSTTTTGGATTITTTNTASTTSANVPVDQLLGNMIDYDAHTYYILCHILDPRCKLKFLSSEYTSTTTSTTSNSSGNHASQHIPSYQDYAHYFQSYFLTYYNIPNTTLSLTTGGAGSTGSTGGSGNTGGENINTMMHDTSLFSNPIHSNHISLGGTNTNTNTRATSATATTTTTAAAAIPIPTTGTSTGGGAGNSGKKWLDQISSHTSGTGAGNATGTTTTTSGHSGKATAASSSSTNHLLPTTVEQEFYEMNLYLQEHVFIPGHYYHPVPTATTTNNTNTTANTTSTGMMAGNGGHGESTTNPWAWSTTTNNTTNLTTMIAGTHGGNGNGTGGNATVLTNTSSPLAATTTTTSSASMTAGSNNIHHMTNTMVNNAAMIDKFDMLLWWSHHENKYIQLSLLVKDLLGLNTSSISYFPPDPVTSIATAAGNILSTTTSTLAANGLLMHQHDEEIVQWLQTLSKEEVVVMMQGISWYRTLKIWQPNGMPIPLPSNPNTILSASSLTPAAVLAANALI